MDDLTRAIQARSRPRPGAEHPRRALLSGFLAAPSACLRHAGRLGAMVEVPSPTIVDQLDLPNDQGLIVADVVPDSAAAKAGVKLAHDILLELDGKAVPNKPEEFVKQLEQIKANKPVDAVVMRKGKKETVRGLSLPEAPKALAGRTRSRLLPSRRGRHPGRTRRRVPCPVLPPSPASLAYPPPAHSASRTLATRRLTLPAITTRYRSVTATPT